MVTHSLPRPVALASIVLAIVACAGCGRLKSRPPPPVPPTAPPFGAVSFNIHLQGGFSGSTVIVSVDGREVYKGQPSTNPLLGLAKPIPTSAVSTRPVLNVSIPGKAINWTQEVDISKGVGIGISVVNGKINMRQARAFGYD